MYTILKEAEDFKDFEFVLKARHKWSKIIGKEVFTYLWIVRDGEELHFVCCDSQRLHSCICDRDLETGIYEVEKISKGYVINKLETQLTHPNISHLLNTTHEEYKIIEPINSKKDEVSRLVSKVLASIACCFIEHNAYINYDSLKDAIVNRETDLSVKLNCDEPRSPIVIENATTKAVIMPCVI
ncbi:MAG: hypothetical protein ACFFG0_02220 [Candidatus Thorarchaeota archaeon]